MLVCLVIALALSATARGQGVELPERMTVSVQPPDGCPQCDPFENGLPGGSFVATDGVPAGPYFVPDSTGYFGDSQPRTWQLLPDGLIYRSYLAGKESRFSGVWSHDKNLGWFLDATLGGRVALLRYGTRDNMHPEGWELDIEGAAFPRINLNRNWDLDSADFRFGIPLTYGEGQWQFKFSPYHLSSHVGDEYLVRNPGFQRINFTRDVLVWGASYYAVEDVRLYGEVGWAYATDGGSKPWELQLGIDYAPARPTGAWGAPFVAINGHLRQEVDYGGNVTAQIGWAWRGSDTRHLFRTGFNYFNGKSDQFEFYNRFEQRFGFGIWYDY